MKILKKNSPSDLNNLIRTLWIITFTISILSFIIVLIYEGWSREISPTSSGFSELLQLYNFPLKALTATLILFGLWLTIERMKQTDKQIAAITSNNRFNNFYKHRSEFESAFENFNFIKKILEYHKLHYKNRLIPPSKKVNFSQSFKDKARRFYAAFYYTKPKHFNDCFNNDILSKINSMNNVIINFPRLDSDTTKIDFENIHTDELSKIINLLPGVISPIITTLARIDVIEIEHSDFSVNDRIIFAQFNVIYWGFIILSDIMAYEDMFSTEIDNFLTGYNSVRIEKVLFYV